MSRERPKRERPARIERFGKTTRWFHWTFALAFLALAGTGSILFLRESLEMSLDTAHDVLRMHQIAAVVLLSAPWLVAFSGDTRRWMGDLAEVTRFTVEDLQWLWAQWPLRRRRPPLPKQHKLNAGQKLNALAIAVLTGTMTVTGAWLWLEPGAFAALLLHIGGFLLWIPAFGVHLFMALVNSGTRPSLRGILLGSVSRAWAEEHHGRWVETTDREGATERS